MTEDLDKAQRRAAMMAKAKSLFITDTTARLDAMVETIMDWQSQKLALEQAVSIIYQHMHAIKGVALTLGFTNCNRVSQQFSDHITLERLAVSDINEIVTGIELMKTELNADK